METKASDIMVGSIIRQIGLDKTYRVIKIAADMQLRAVVFVLADTNRSVNVGRDDRTVSHTWIFDEFELVK